MRKTLDLMDSAKKTTGREDNRDVKKGSVSTNGSVTQPKWRGEKRKRGRSRESDRKKGMRVQ